MGTHFASQPRMTRLAFFQTLAALTFLSACALPGDGAASGDLTCPEGETCSSKTPDGLWFSGAGFFDELFDEGPHTIASGGTQTITVLASNTSIDHFTNPFHAETASPLVVEDTNPPTVTVRAEGSGSSYLRIVDPGSLDLYDRISIGVASIASIRVTPVEATWFDPGAAFDLDWALFAGASLDLGVVLRDSSDNRLVDESLTFTISGGASENGSQGTWDTSSITIGSFGTADVFAQSGGGDTFSHNMPIVTTIDDAVIVENAFSTNTSLSIPAGAERVYCFRGLSGNRAVAGLSWSISVDGQITAKHADASCFNVKATTMGNATLFASAGDFKKAFPITITTSAAAPPTLQMTAPDRPRTVGPAKGDRCEGRWNSNESTHTG